MYLHLFDTNLNISRIYLKMYIKNFFVYNFVYNIFSFIIYLAYFYVTVRSAEIIGHFSKTTTGTKISVKTVNPHQQQFAPHIFRRHQFPDFSISSTFLFLG